MIEKVEKQTPPAEKPPSHDLAQKGVFSPKKELEAVRRARPEEKRTRIEEYKEQLSRQKEGIAEMQTELIEEIRKNPDITRREFETKANAFARRAELDQERFNIALEAFDEYQKKHAKIRELRDRFPNGEDIFFAVFGQRPRGKITVKEGPMTICFQCFSIEDFALLHGGAYIVPRKPDEDEIKFAKEVNGFIVRNSPIPGLDQCITVENMSAPIGQETPEHRNESSGVVFAHEEQHAIKKLFAETAVREETLAAVRTSSSDEERHHHLEKYFRYIRKAYVDALAKDEILARLTDNTVIPENLISLFTTKDEPYDFPGKLKTWIEQELAAGLEASWMKRQLKKIGKAPTRIEGLDGSLQVLIDETWQKIFVKEYHRVIAQAIDSVGVLRDAGYSKERIISLLTHEPLSKWEKAVMRLLGDKKKA